MSLHLPRIAVCLAAFNGMRWLDKQIATILDQKDVFVTIYISVDISTDGTEKYIEGLASREHRVIFLPQGCRFGNAARNFFRLLTEIDFSSYDYIAFADQDDLWHTNKLGRAVTMLTAFTASGYSSNVTAFWPDGRKMLVCKSQPQRRWDYMFESAGPGCTFVMRLQLANAIRTCLIANAGMAAHIDLHDWFCYAFARAHGYSWLIDDFSGLFYRQHSDNLIGVNRGLQAFLYRAHKVFDGWWLRQSLLIAQLTGSINTPFVNSWSALKRRELLRLACQARNCRRRPKDQLLFAISCLCLAIFGVRH